MTEEEWAGHKRELQRKKTIRLKESKSGQRLAKLMQETQEEHDARRAQINERRRELSRAKGVHPRQAMSPEERTARKVEWARKKRQHARMILVDRYGGRCVCCGVTDYRWLSLHHVNGDGADDRRAMKVNHANRLYALVNQPKRDDLALLCYNCHLARDFFGICPHQDASSPYSLDRRRAAS